MGKGRQVKGMVANGSSYAGVLIARCADDAKRDVSEGKVGSSRNWKPRLQLRHGFVMKEDTVRQSILERLIMRKMPGLGEPMSCIHPGTTTMVKAPIQLQRRMRFFFRSTPGAICNSPHPNLQSYHGSIDAILLPAKYKLDDQGVVRRVWLLLARANSNAG